MVRSIAMMLHMPVCAHTHEQHEVAVAKLPHLQSAMHLRYPDEYAVAAWNLRQHTKPQAKSEYNDFPVCKVMPVDALQDRSNGSLSR